MAQTKLCAQLLYPKKRLPDWQCLVAADLLHHTKIPLIRFKALNQSFYFGHVSHQISHKTKITLQIYALFFFFQCV